MLCIFAIITSALNNPLSYINQHFRNKAKQTNYIFLFSHMRGYTSLLSHIIGSNPEVKGYTEMHQGYRSTLGLLKLRYFSKLTTGDTEVPSYLFDKILHNKYGVSGAILRQKNVYPIIMVREPEATMKSIINMGEKYSKVVAWYRNPDKVTDYYIKRLKRLQRVAEQSRGKALFVNAQDIIDDPDSVLGSISNYLNLEQKLSKEYNTFSLTGAKGAGDPSENIKKGKIVKSRDQYDAIAIPQNTLAKAQKVYQETINYLTENCQRV